jgi:hypothetical protein
VRAAVVRLSSQGVRKAVASGPEVLRSISLVTGALALGERPKAFRHRQEAAAELRTEIRLTLRKDTTARSQRLGGRAALGRSSAACSGWRSAAKRNSEWIAARRVLRLRALLPRSCSRWSRNAPTSGAR